MLLEMTSNPCPAGAQTGMVTTADGVRLRSASWVPQGPQRGTILMLQGRAEFIEKYFETIARFLDWGFAVICFDWRGQGGSDRLLEDPMKGHIDAFEDYQKDLQAIRAYYAHLLEQPVLTFAHSMGGMILLRALKASPDLAKAAVMTAPMLDIQLLRQQSWLKTVISTCCLIGMKNHYPPLHRSQSPFTMKFERNPLTRNRSRFERNQMILRTRPDLALGMPTLGWLKEAMRAIDDLPQVITSLQQSGPRHVLVIAPKQDRVTASEATRSFCAALDHVELVEINEIEHEVLMEHDAVRAQFWSAVEEKILPLF